MKILSVVLLTAALAGSAFAKLRLPAVISSGMVLQRESEAPVWGWAAAGQDVTVEIAGQSKLAKAGDDGKWMLKLDPLAAGGPHQMKIAAGGDNVLLENVLVGEVWLCSGQSNMEWSVNASKNPNEEKAAANYPNVRLFYIAKRPATMPQDDVPSNWAECSPESVGGFSAVGYFFGRHLHKELEGVPIGLIGSAWGGTRIEPWTPLEGFAKVAKVKGIGEGIAKQLEVIADPSKFIPTAEKWVEQVKAHAAKKKAPPAAPRFPGNFNQGTPTGLYNGMISPVVPYGLRGAIWYQGESNNGEGMLYHEKMKALIAGWRDVFQKPDLAFHFVQLAPFKYGNGETTLPYIWEAQTATLKVPGTGMAVISDIGNVNDIHPRNKQDVGKRLALWALAKNYGKGELVYSGPIYRSIASSRATRCACTSPTPGAAWQVAGRRSRSHRFHHRRCRWELRAGESGHRRRHGLGGRRGRGRAQERALRLAPHDQPEPVQQWSGTARRARSRRTAGKGGTG